MKRYDYKKIVIEEKLGVILALLAGFFLTVASVIMFVNMTTRTVADINIRFVYEVAQLCGAGVASFAIPYATIKSAHTEMDIITSHMKPKKRALLEGFSGIVTMIVMVYVVYVLLDYAWIRTLVFETTKTTHLPMWIFRWTYAIGMLVTTLAAIIEMIDCFRIALGKEVVRNRDELEALGLACPELGISPNENLLDTQTNNEISEEGGEKI